MAKSIPTGEFTARVKRLQSAMEREGYEFILAYGNEAEPQYVRYFSDYWPSFETAGVLVPACGDAALLIGPESQTYASDRSRLDKIYLLRAFRESSDPEYPGKKLDTFGDVFRALGSGGKIGKFGVAGLSLMTVGVHGALSEALADFGSPEISNAGYLVNELRMIKTAPELECMREAAEITRKTFDFMLENIKPGMTECQAVGLALGKMHELGAERESYPPWILTGEGSHQAISRPRHKPIDRDDITFIQIGARVAGYASSIGRPVVFSREAAKRFEPLIRAGYAGFEATVAAMCAGALAGDIADAHEAAVTAAGFGDHILYGPCHGNGLMEGEAPWIEKGASFKLRENMTFCVDIFLGSPATKRGLRIEDVVRVTADGTENLTNYPREIFVL